MKANIHLEENLNIKADNKGKIVSSDSNGVLSINNKSSSTTLWGIDLRAEIGADISGFPEETVPHIEASKSFTRNYGTTVNPLLEINEKVDTNFDGTTINVKNKDLVFGIDQNLAFQITVKNNFTFKLENIKVEKYLPIDTKEIRAIDPFPGEITIETDARKAKWVIPFLKPGESATLIVSSLCHPTTVQPYKTGQIFCKCEGNSKMSSITPSIKAEADNVDLEVKALESDTANQWNVEFGLRNGSEFELMLTKVTISVNDVDKFNQEPKEHIDAKSDQLSWKQQIVVTSNDYPEITKSFDYYVQYEVTEHSVIHYEKDNDIINVTKVDVVKTFEPAHATTYTVVPLVATIDIKNSGTSNVGSLKIEDTIPAYMMVDKVLAESAQKALDIDFLERPKEEVKVQEEHREVATFEELEGDKEEKVEEVLPPKPEDISEVRKYHYDLKALEIAPGEIVKVKVIGKANKPKVGGDHPAPAIIDAFAPNPTKAYRTEAKFEGKEPKLIVDYKKRSYKITSIFKKLTENEFEIEIPVENSGEVPLDNVLVTQPIFNSEYTAHTPPTVDVQVEGSNVKCHIKRINIGEIVKIVLTVKSEGPLRQQQATIKIQD